MTSHIRRFLCLFSSNPNTKFSASLRNWWNNNTRRRIYSFPGCRHQFIFEKQENLDNNIQKLSPIWKYILKLWIKTLKNSLPHLITFWLIILLKCKGKIVFCFKETLFNYVKRNYIKNLHISNIYDYRISK